RESFELGALEHRERELPARIEPRPKLLLKPAEQRRECPQHRLRRFVLASGGCKPPVVLRAVLCVVRLITHFVHPTRGFTPPARLVVAVLSCVAVRLVGSVER